MNATHSTTVARTAKNTYMVGCSCGWSLAITTKVNNRTGQAWPTIEIRAREIAATHKNEGK